MAKSILKINIRLLVALYVLLILLYFLFRMIFLIYNYHAFQGISASELLLAVIQGIEFDLSAISRTFGFIFIVFLLTGKLGWRSPGFSFWKYLTAAVLAIEIFFLAVGPITYQELNKLISYDIYSAEGEFSGLLKHVASEHWLYSLGIALVMFLSIRLWLKIWNNNRPEPDAPLGGWIKYSVVVFCFFLLSALGLRGGFRPFPLFEAHAFTGSSPRLGYLRLNTVFTVSLALQRGRIERVNYLPDQEAIHLTQHLLADKDEIFIDKSRPLLRKKRGVSQEPVSKPNIVMIILEGVPACWINGIAAKPETGGLSTAVDKPVAGSIHPNLTPNLDRLIERSVVYTNFFSNGFYTSDAFPAIMTSIPIFHDRNLITSGILQQPLVSIPLALRGIGYTSLFLNPQFHNTITVFMSSIGFDRIVDEFDIDSDLKTPWGYQDEVAFARLHRELKTLPEPFFAAMITVSTHSPYLLPDKKWNRFTGDTRHERDWKNALHYTDYQIGQFFKNERTRPSFKRTIYVITADHTRNTPPGQFLDMFRIPLIIYSPGGQVSPGRNPTFASHVDLLPTLIDGFGLHIPHASAGTSFLSPEKKHGIILMTDKTDYFGYQNDYLYQFDQNMHPIAVFDVERDPENHRNLIEHVKLASVDNFRAYKQSFLSLLAKGRIAR